MLLPAGAKRRRQKPGTKSTPQEKASADRYKEKPNKKEKEDACLDEGPMSFRQHLEEGLKTAKKGNRKPPRGWAEKTEEKIIDEQFEMIKKKHGEKVAKNANYGWGVSSDKDYVSVATKVSGYGILQSSIQWPDTAIDHKWG